LVSFLSIFPTIPASLLLPFKSSAFYVILESTWKIQIFDRTRKLKKKHAFSVVWIKSMLYTTLFTAHTLTVKASTSHKKEVRLRVAAMMACC